MNGKYLVDQRDAPFLIKEISAWGLIQSLNEPDEAAFMDSVKSKGFNTLLVSIISFDTRFAGGPPTWQGISPFRIKWDFSSYNLPYFEHVDRFLDSAKSRNMLVLLVPCYLGYKGDGNQGWWDELLSKNNDPTKSYSYGQFLSDRYRNTQNMVWVAGGDNSADGPLFDHMDAIIRGIKWHDQAHLWTGHFDSSTPTNWSTGNFRFAKYIDLDGLYDFTESSLGKEAPQYKAELNHYGGTKMIFQLDQSYEHDIPHGADNENMQWIRRKNYEGLLSGCAGSSFSPGAKNNQCYTFTNWRPLMNTEGMWQIKYFFQAFENQRWYELIPDKGNKFISGGRGNFGTLDYVCVAAAADSSLLMAYLPTSRPVTVNLQSISGKLARAWWFNPLDGKTTWIGIFSTDAAHVFIPEGEQDWLLIVERASLSPARSNAMASLFIRHGGRKIL